MRGSAW